MTEQLLIDTVERIMADERRDQLPTPPPEHWDRDAWHQLGEAGLRLVGVSEVRGGSGGTLADALAIARAIAASGMSVPYADTTVVAGWLLESAGIDVPDGPVLCCVTEADLVDRRDVAWGAVAELGVLVRHSTDGALAVHLVELAGTMARSHDVSGEHGGDLREVIAPADDLAVRAHGRASIALDDVALRLALVRSAQMTGALEGLLPRCVRYATERQQFGQPIAAFQAVRHLLARLAGEVVAAQAALDLATSGVPAAIAAGKVRIGEAASTGARLAHQIHGAIGFTDEHELARFTRRLWRWRDDAGNEAHWAAVLGASIAGRPEGDLWSLLTSVPSPASPDARAGGAR